MDENVVSEDNFLKNMVKLREKYHDDFTKQMLQYIKPLLEALEDRLRRSDNTLDGHELQWTNVDVIQDSFLVLVADVPVVEGKFYDTPDGGRIQATFDNMEILTNTIRMRIPIEYAAIKDQDKLQAAVDAIPITKIDEVPDDQSSELTPVQNAARHFANEFKNSLQNADDDALNTVAKRTAVGLLTGINPSKVDDSVLDNLTDAAVEQLAFYTKIHGINDTKH